jgi:heme/copper-type cytochrome/quinol oxidase subunit 1
MASLVWTTIFLFLLLELALTFILVMPVPRKIRNFLAKEIFKFNLGERMRKPILFIGVALSFALVESYVAHQRILARLEQEKDMGIPSQISHDRYFHGHDKERKYKAERNMYLAGFTLTLLFVIGRITTLMQESVELEEETKRVKIFTEEATNADAKHAAGDKKKD